MAESLRFDDQQQTLVLHGDLDRETLLPLWRQRAELLKGKTAIDVAQLRRVDSSGLALLVHLRAEQLRNGVELKISGATDRLRTLIALYNLQGIMPVETRS